MNDPVFLDAFYWLLMNRNFLIIASAVFTFIAVLISLMLIMRRWGESF
jgi:hypothetical protein